MLGPPTKPDTWAKIVQSGEYWHPLIAHSADVAVVFEILLRDTKLGDRLARLMETSLTDAQICRLVVLAALHDAGKANVRFQNKFYGGPTSTHQVPILHLLFHDRKRLKPLFVDEIRDWFQGEGLRWIETTWSHHGAPIANPEDSAPIAELWNDRAMTSMQRLGEAVRGWYPDAFRNAAPLPASPAAHHLYNGILTLADWIASDDGLFNWRQEEAHDLRDPVHAKQVAEKRARTAIRDIHLLPPRPSQTTVDALLDEGDTSYAVQNATRDAPAPDDGSLVVLESPTGSGKTEGVLARYARLLELGQVDSLFFAVPTRAAAKQLWRRVCEATKRIFGSDELRPHLAVPGYLRAGDATGTFVGRSVRWDEPIGPAGWAAESSKRYTSSPIAVGTTDQVLLSGLKNRHAHLRSAGLARSLLVIDEVHASSTYMHETLRNIIDLHLSAGGHTVLMSATLGTSVRTDYTGETEKPFGKACEESYPRVTTRTSEGVHSSDPLPSPGRPKQIRIAEEAICGDPQAVADRAAAAARDGARVLVIRNTVSACRQTFNCLPQDVSFELAGVPCPHHSRFTSEDRRALDEKIERYYGKTPEREVSPGLVTIATQTVEQSLDIDADLLITDLCPMDVLLQRIGRLHRHVHNYPRPDGYDVPCCVVLAPPHSIGSYINTNKGAFFSPIPGAGTVYNEIAVLKATRDALTGRPMIEIPKENRLLVEKSLHPERLDDIRSRDPYTAIAGQSAQQHRRERLIAHESILDWDRSYVEQPFPSERLATRLGLMTITADLPKPVETPFGNRSEAVPISPYQLSEEELETLPEQPEAHDVQPIQNGFTFKLVGKQFRYDHCGVAANC